MKTVAKTGNITSKIIKFVLITAVIVLVPLTVLTTISPQTNYLSGLKGFVVVSGSMEPAIPTGSTIYTAKKSFYNPSDVIVFNHDERVVTHRIVGIETLGSEPFYRTKGDANSVEDSSLVNKNDIVGATFVSVPYLGRIVMLFKTPIGFAAGIVLPTLLYLASELIRVRKALALASNNLL